MTRAQSCAGAFGGCAQTTLFFLGRFRALSAAPGPKPRWFLIDVEAVSYIDATAIDALRTLHGELAGQGVRLTIARAKHPIRTVFDSSGITRLLGADAFFPTVRSGVAAFEQPGRDGFRGGSRQA